MKKDPRYPLRREVEEANSSRLASLPGPAHTYTALDIEGHDIRGRRLSPEQAQRLLDRLVALKTITLKVLNNDCYIIHVPILNASARLGHRPCSSKSVPFEYPSGMTSDKMHRTSAKARSSMARWAR